MPHNYSRDKIPFKVVRCRYYDLSGERIFPYCAEGGSCSFLHPYDKGWPGLEPKPPYRLDYDSSSLARKRSRPPPPSPTRSRSPEARRSRRGRSPSPVARGRDYYSSSSTNRFSKNSSWSLASSYRPKKLSSYSEAPQASGSNTITLKSSRYNRSATSIDSGSSSRSPELLTPSDKHLELPNESSQAHRKDGLGSSAALDTPGSRDRNESPRENNSRVSTVNSISQPKGGSDAAGYVPAPVGTLLSRLTKVHLRLLEDRKAYDEETLKLQAFESLASIAPPGSLTTGPSLTMLEPSGKSSAFERYRVRTGAALSASASRAQANRSNPSSGSPQSSTPIQNNKKSASESIALGKSGNPLSPLADRLAHKDPETTEAMSIYAGDGHDHAHEALLETLDSIRQHRRKIGQRVQDDFDEMGLLLQEVWLETARAHKGSPRTGTTTRHRSRTDPSEKYVSPTTVQGDPSTANNGFNGPDQDPRALKKLRRVSFGDESTFTKQEREMLRGLEEKMIGIEKKLGRVTFIEKENAKMRMELKASKEALNAVTKSLDWQRNVIAELARRESNATPTPPSSPEMGEVTNP